MGFNEPPPPASLRVNEKANKDQRGTGRNQCPLTLEPLQKNKLHEHFFCGGSFSDRSDPSSTFDTIHQIGMIFGTYNKLPWYFQLSEIT